MSRGLPGWSSHLCRHCVVARLQTALWFLFCYEISK